MPLSYPPPPHTHTRAQGDREVAEADAAEATRLVAGDAVERELESLTAQLAALKVTPLAGAQGASKHTT